MKADSQGLASEPSALRAHRSDTQTSPAPTAGRVAPVTSPRAANTHPWALRTSLDSRVCPQRGRGTHCSCCSAARRVVKWPWFRDRTAGAIQRTPGSNVLYVTPWRSLFCARQAVTKSGPPGGHKIRTAWNQHTRTDAIEPLALGNTIPAATRPAIRKRVTQTHTCPQLCH